MVEIKHLLYSILFTFVVASIFIFYPELDIEFSRIFFLEESKKFYYVDNTFLKIISNLAYCLAFLLLLYNFISLIKKKISNQLFNLSFYKIELTVLLVFLIGSVIIIQCCSKHYFGRPRPIYIKEFGGNLIFSPAFKVSNECKYNCSFVSFHTSIGLLFFFHSLGSASAKKYFMIFASCLLTLILGLTRIIQGNHFLSDVIIAACFMTIIYYLITTSLAYIVKKKYDTVQIVS